MTPAFVAGDTGMQACTRRVLVVDDHPDAADAMAALLEMDGYDVRTAYDPLQALDAAPQFAPQCCILDIGLPVMDGYELAERLRAMPGLSDCRMIAVSGYDEARAGRPDPFSAHLLKPIDFDRLVGLIGTAMLCATEARPDRTPTPAALASRPHP